MSVFTTKYTAPTNTRGARITVSLAKGWGKVTPLVVAYDYEKTGWQNHRDAAKAFAISAGLPGTFLTVDAGSSGYTFARETAISDGFTVAQGDVVDLEALLADA
jgi:hypothetical protein